MANELSIKVSTDARAAVADFKRLTDQIHATEMAARRAGGGFQSMGNAAEHSLNRIAVKAAQARREIQQMTRAQSGPQFGAATGGGYTGGGSFAIGGPATLIGGAIATAGVGAISALGSASYSAARDEAAAQTYLANAVKMTGQAYAQQADEVAKLGRQLGTTKAQAMALQAGALRFTSSIGRPQDAGKLGLALGNALAAGGRSADEIPDRIRQLQSGEDALFDVLGPVKIGNATAGSPEAIYKAYAKEILNVKRELTDLEKMQARYYAVLQAGEAAQGAATERMKTSVGQIDKLTNSFTDLAAAIGKAALESSVFSGGLGFIDKSMQGLKHVVNNPPSGFASNYPGAGLISAMFLGGLETTGRLMRSTPARGPGLGPPAANLPGAYTGLLDTRVNLSRDPFSYQESNLAARNEYLSARSGARTRVDGLVGGAAGNFENYFALGTRLNEVRAAGGGAQESEADRLSRFFGTASRFSDVALATYRASGAFGDVDERAARATRQFLVSGLSGADVNALSADQRAAYEDALLKAQEDQLKNAAETLAAVIKMEKNLKRLADKLDPTDIVEEPPITIQLDNRADVVARFAAVATGDSLRSDQ